MLFLRMMILMVKGNVDLEEHGTSTSIFWKGQDAGVVVYRAVGHGVCLLHMLVSALAPISKATSKLIGIG